MTFENFTELSGATLRNAPAVASFERVITQIERLERGDLFLSNLPSDIEIAVAKGAHGIVSESNVQISDPEIAWFRVDSLDRTLLKLLRFSLLHKKRRFFHSDPVTLAYLEALLPHKTTLFLDRDIARSYRRILAASPDTMIFSDDKTLLETIYPDFTPVEKKKHTLTLTHRTLFQSSFLYRGRYYPRIKVPPLFLDEYATALEFCRREEIEIDIAKTPFIPHFHPFFVNKNLKPQRYGTTDHVLIAQEDTTQIERVYRYLEKEAGWAKILLLLPQGAKIPSLSERTREIVCDSVADLRKLEGVDFHFAIVAQKSAIIREFLERQNPKEIKPLLKESYD